ncbi:hypothetical protein IC229_26175 [Spirosoma sp. BT702]|uniref:Uncharacterized protein n=1 Tax=Spirosoma profusum TaxID=2771354 RepID=A0A927ASN8_9BACT|nr:hypothetical protein [Spirosoma profusum]
MNPTTQQPNQEPLPGDYYGVIYKGGLLIPLGILIGLAFGVWWIVRRRKK